MIYHLRYPPPPRAFEDSLKFSQVLCALESLSVPTVAILNGTTLGGGLELSLACDYRIADETCTQIGLPEVKIGVLPGLYVESFWYESLYP